MTRFKTVKLATDSLQLIERLLYSEKIENERQAEATDNVGLRGLYDERAYECKTALLMLELSREEDE